MVAWAKVVKTKESPGFFNNSLDTVKSVVKTRASFLTVKGVVGFRCLIDLDRTVGVSVCVTIVSLAVDSASISPFFLETVIRKATPSGNWVAAMEKLSPL